MGAGAHGRDIALLLPFGHPLTRPLSLDWFGDPEDTACTQLSALFIEAVASFARTKVPTTRGHPWRRGVTMLLRNQDCGHSSETPLPEVTAVRREMISLARELGVDASSL